MIDASKYELIENIKITKEVVEYKRKNVSVEAEVGFYQGVEDNIISNIRYAKIEDCDVFVKNKS